MAIDNSSQVALGADVASALYGVDGTGLKIGIISDSFNNKGGAAGNVAAGDLPANVTVLRDLASGGSDEGRAMTQLAYRIAPGASYYFASGYSDPGSTVSNIQSCADAVAALQAAGCNIIVDDLGFFGAEPVYQLGTVLDQAIENAVNAGVDYFSAAGNDGKNFYEQGFAPMSVTIGGLTGTANDFGGGNAYLDVTISAAAKVKFYFGWAQPSASLGGAGAQNSLAISLLDPDGHVVASAIEDQVGDNAAQFFKYVNDTGQTHFRLLVTQNGGTVPAGELFKIFTSSSKVTFDSPNANSGSGNVFGHEMLPGQNSVAAVPYSKTPAFGTSPAVPEYFTSVGPGLVLYDPQGNPLATPVVPNEPYFAAAENSDTTVPGFAPFPGTSAAAPNAGAVGALVLEANSALTTAEITSVLAQSAIPIDTDLMDTGAGLIQAPAAVEIAAAYAGNRFVTQAGGDWTDAANWSAGIPDDTQAVSLDDNLGALTASYSVTLDAAATAGSVAIAMTGGNSARLVLDRLASLAVGGPTAGDITANDMLIATGGTLVLAGGTLAVARNLNLNNGVARLLSGQASAGAVDENAGLLTIGGGLVGSPSPSVVEAPPPGPASLTVGGAFRETGGETAVLSQGTLSAASIMLSAGLFTDAGLIEDTGALSSIASGTMTLDGGTLSIGATASGVAIDFADGGGLLAFTSSDSAILTGGLTSVISGLASPDSAIDFTGLAYDSGDSYAYDDGTLTIREHAGPELAQLSLDPATYYAAFTLSADAEDGLLVQAAPCFRAGTRILTQHGPRAVEALAVGDVVRTLSGALAPVTWVGHRVVDCARHPDPRRVWPVRVQAGAFGPDASGVDAPHADLWLSPDHAVFAAGVLIPIHALANGSTIAQVPVDRVAYFHVELARHDVILAEGLPCESYLDTGNRGAFANGGATIALHPDFSAPTSNTPAWDTLAWDALACAPLCVTGPAVAAARAIVSLAASRGANRGAHRHSGGGARRVAPRG